MWRVNKDSGPVILACRHREVLISFVALMVSGCCSDPDHLHISMLDSMEVLEYGKTHVNGVTDRTDMPIRYKLEREHYSLYSIIHQRSIPAQAIFYVEGKDLIDANIRGYDTSGCGGFRPVSIIKYREGPYPEGSIGITMHNFPGEPCQNDLFSSGAEYKFIFTIHNGLGDVVAEEEISYTLAAHGIYHECDGL